MPDKFFLYLLVMAGVTYLIRMLPIVLMKKKLKNKFLRSFLYYIPYAVLGAMTFPAIIYSTNSIISACVGVVVAILVAYFEKGLLAVAGAACFAVLITELIMRYVIYI